MASFAGHGCTETSHFLLINWLALIWNTDCFLRFSSCILPGMIPVNYTIFFGVGAPVMYISPSLLPLLAGLRHGCWPCPWSWCILCNIYIYRRNSSKFYALIAVQLTKLNSFKSHSAMPIVKIQKLGIPNAKHHFRDFSWFFVPLLIWLYLIIKRRGPPWAIHSMPELHEGLI